MKKREEIKHFDVERLKKFQNNRIMAFIIFLLSFSFIIYSSYNIPVFTLFVILAWLGLLVSIVGIFSAEGGIMGQNIAKLKLKSILEQNKSKSLLELAQEMEFPYSILKQNVDYLKNKGELFNYSFP